MPSVRPPIMSDNYSYGSNNTDRTDRVSSLNSTHRLACASGRGWGTISERRQHVPCPRLLHSLCCFPQLPWPSEPVRKGVSGRFLSVFAPFFFKPFPPRVHTLSPLQTPNPLRSLSVLASRTTLYVTSPDSSYHRGVVHPFHSCDVAVREPVVVHDGPLRIAECELGLACHTGR